MSDSTNLIPISDEQAKLGQEIVGAARDAGGYFTDLLGDLPKDLVSLLIGDRVKVRRVARLAKLWENARNRLQEDGIAEPVPPNLKLALPILIAAADENRDELQDLWARLLAATMNPNKARHFRQEFSHALEKMRSDRCEGHGLFQSKRRGGSE
jgi:Abortive infection alpha